MAYFGEVEQKNLHGLICVPVLPKSLAGMSFDVDIVAFEMSFAFRDAVN